ncbi:MAG: Acyl-CoA thioesterase [Alphaproteobacteria bacterium]|nr:Acyl-CoA thioesterase [Alphaproteobacteria bacterium]
MNDQAAAMVEIEIRDRTAELAGLFAFDEVEKDRFRAAASRSPMQRLYGGQVIAQALSAAQRTVRDGRLAHSCHAYFVRPGHPDLPIDLAVTRDSDGRSFSARRANAVQGDRLILSLSASFQDSESGPEHQFEAPDVPGPEGLQPQSELLGALGTRLPPRHHAFWLRDTGFDFRSVESFVTFSPEPMPARRHFWFRLRNRIGDDPAEHQRLFAYASDLYLLHAGLLPLGVSWAEPSLQDASLDHSIWFHDRFRIDEWLLYALDSPRAGHARTLARGQIFTRDGRLVVSVAQEGLIRLPPDFAG